MAPLEPFDPAAMPLGGIRLIEASAGTGKTFSLANLYLRLIVEHRLDVQDILVMTFTRAAAQELRERLRANLARAARVAAEAPDDQRSDAAERFAEHVLAGVDEDRGAVAQRLRAAATRADQATITTIHGFAQRAAAENAFESALPFDRGEPIDDRAIQREAAADYWRARAFARDAAHGQAFVSLWPTPEALHRELREPLAKPHAALVRRDFDALERMRQDALARWPDARPAFVACLQEAFDAGGLRKNAALNQWLLADGAEALADAIEHGLAGTPDGLPALPAVVADLGSAAAVKRQAHNKACQWFRPQDIDGVALLARLQVDGRLAAAAHAVDGIRALAARRKTDKRQYSFDDMIAALYDAITDAERGPGLARALRRTWPWALVDEFQDTDPLQYAILRRIYGGPHPPTPSPDGRGGETGERAPSSHSLSPAGGETGDQAPSSHFLSPAGGETGDQASSPHSLSPTGGEGQGEGAETPPAGLILIGDPKQAIYAFRGGDVFTYLDAAADADGRYGMATNHRSTPAVVRGLDTLFSAGGDGAFVIDGIDFFPVDHARASDDQRILTDDGPLAGVHAWSIPADAPAKREQLETRIRNAVVDRIAALLTSARTVDATGARQSLAPSAIAVLVNTNQQAATMQAALADAGVPAVCIHQQSVFTTDAARDLLWLLRAIAAPLDPDPLRRVLTTPLFGLRLGELVALDADEARWSQWTERFQAAHVQWGRSGVQAMLEPFLQEAASRVLARTDGERRLTDYLHVAERLQEAEHEVFGREGLVRWLERAIADSGEAEVTDADRLRLADDSDLVQVTTVHKAKGLQWPVVFVPFAPWLGTGGPSKPGEPPLVFHDDANQTVIDPGSADVAANRARALREHKAEQMRSLYVALTRAEEALFFVHGAAKQALDGPLAWLLHRQDGAPLDEWHGTQKLPPWFEAGRVHQRLTELARASDAALSAAALPAIETPRRFVRAAEGELTPARSDWPAPRAPWSILSYSRLAGRLGGVGEEVAGHTDEADTPVEASASADDARAVLTRPRGAGFGQAVHAILEEADFAAWPLPGTPPGKAQAAVVAAKLRQHGIATDPGNGADPVADTVALIGHTLHAPLPEIGPLAAIPGSRRRSEMEFFLRLDGGTAEGLLERIAAAGYSGARADALPTLRGLMHGMIDLVVEHAGRYWILDYKTNLLGPTRADYTPPRLRAAIAAHHYDLQYLLYSVALHRHLRQVLPGYDPAMHLGGVLCLFVRGLDRDGEHGVFADRPEPGLIKTLDALLDGRPEAA